MHSEMLDWIREIVALGVRRPGSPGDLSTERFLARRFEEFGLNDIRLEPVDVNHWSPAETQLTVKDDSATIPCFAVPYTAWTPGEGIEAEAVAVGSGSPEELDAVDLQGRIAVLNVRFGQLALGALTAGAHFVRDEAQDIAEGPPRSTNWLIENFPAYYEVQRRGAVGLVGILADSAVDGPDHYVPYDGHLKELPAVWVGRESGAELTACAQRGGRVVLKSTGSTSRVESHNVVATVPGAGDESIILTCHHDAPFASAVEDASGLSVLMWLARHFANRGAKLQRNLVFVVASGHFHGGIGNRMFVDRHRDGLLRDTVAALGIEHVAEEAESDGSGGYRLTGRPEPRVLFVDKNPALIALLRDGVERWQVDRTMAIDPYLFGPEPPCDSAPFYTAGIPSVCHISGPLYLFDPHDTVDKVRADDLPRVAGLFRELVEAIDPLPADTLRAGIRPASGDASSLPPWFQPPPEIGT